MSLPSNENERRFVILLRCFEHSLTVIERQRTTRIILRFRSEQIRTTIEPHYNRDWLNHLEDPPGNENIQEQTILALCAIIRRIAIWGTSNRF